MSPSAPFIRAVVVTTGRPGFLTHALTALAAQEHPIDAWHVVSTSPDKAALAIPDDVDIPVATVTAGTFGNAVTAFLADTPAEDDEWLWLLHDDSAPEHRALARLAPVIRKRMRAGIIGATTTRFDDPRHTVNSGTTVSRVGARRMGVTDGDDLDQGQHDGREDALAVSLVGALVKRSVWEKLGGTDPAYGPFGDSLDFCRRSWRAGHDVVVVPSARVRHAQATLYGRTTPDELRSDHRGTLARRRASEWYHALAWAPAWAVPLLLLWATVSSVTRAALRFAGTEFAVAPAELRVPFVLFTRLPKLAASRARVAKAGTIPTERPLLAGALTVARHIRTRELGAYEAWRAEGRPTDVQSRELRSLAQRRRWTLLGVAGALGAISFALFGSWLSRIVEGEMLAGAALGATNVSFGELWQRTWTGWSDIGLGAGTVDGWWAALMLPLAALPGGLAVGVGLLLTFAPLWAGLAAWFGSGAATRSVTARALAAIAWSVWPPFIQSVTDGRVGSVIAHVGLPLFALALARAVSANRRDRLGDGSEFPSSKVGSPGAGALAGLVMTIITIAAPALLIPLLVVVAAVAVAARGTRRIALLVPVVPLVFAVPGLLAAWAARSGEWLSVLLREPGPALPSDPASPWQLLFGLAQAPPEWPQVSASLNVVLGLLGGVAVVAVAAAALASRVGAPAVRAGWFLAAAGLATAVVTHHTVAAPAGLDGSLAANGWPAPALSLMAVGLVGAALVGVRAGIPPAKPVPPAVARAERAANVAAAVLVSLVLAVQVSATAWPGRDFGGDVHPTASELMPLVSGLERDSAPRSRVLVLREVDGAVAYTIVTRDGSTALLGRGFADGVATSRDFGIPPLAAQQLADTVAALAGAAPGAADGLAQWGIGAVVVAPGSDALTTALLRHDTLTVVGSSERGVTWRVFGDAGDPDSPRVARAWLESPEGARVPLDAAPTGLMAQIPAGEPDRVVVVATAYTDGWTATLGRRELAAVDAGGRVAFEVGSDAGLLTVEYRDKRYRSWWWFGVLAVAWSLFNAIPIRDRRFRKEET